MNRKMPPNAFELYFGLGPSRSYQALAKQLGVSKRTVTATGTRERWQERILELERKAKSAGEQKVLETLESMNARHLKALHIIQAKALETLRRTSLEAAMDAVRSLDMALRHERLIRGEPTERTALSVEEVIRREYERWMTDDGEDGEPAEQDAAVR